MNIGYVAAQTEETLSQAIETLAEEYPLVDCEAAEVCVSFRRVNERKRAVRIRPDFRGLQVEYTDLAAALRGVGTVLASQGQPVSVEEQTGFETLGIMLDCSRNAVMKVSHFKAWLRRLALLGFNMAMLYTEDTYALEGEPFFGHLRGAYTPDELRDIDAYAQRLGIEMVPCIQTLGHLSQILKWSAYRKVKDTSSVILAREEKTYALIERMVAHWAEVFSSKRIHIGMDEAHDLGRGVFLDRFGFENAFDIFNEHLGRVVEICRNHEYRPMIWSDMYFRLSSKTGDYYDPESVIPEEVKAKIPKKAELVYWDYYHTDEAFYTDWIERHRALGFEPIMASGVWTWCSVWHAANYTETKAGPCVKACADAGVKEFLFTLWGDDGGMCDFDSAMHGLAFGADLAYAGKIDDDLNAGRIEFICGGDVEAGKLGGALSFFEVPGTEPGVEVCAWPWLWDDPLLGIYWNDVRSQCADAWLHTLKHYETTAEQLSTWLDEDEPSDCLCCSAEHAAASAAGDTRHAWVLATVLAGKIMVRETLEQAYAKRDAEALRDFADHVGSMIELLLLLDDSFRCQWMRRNKPFGLEIVQTRLAGLIRRYRELGDRVVELADGKIDEIEELEQPLDQPAHVHPSYRCVASACAPGI